MGPRRTTEPITIRAVLFPNSAAFWAELAGISRVNDFDRDAF